MYCTTEQVFYGCQDVISRLQVSKFVGMCNSENTLDVKETQRVTITSFVGT